MVVKNLEDLEEELLRNELLEKEVEECIKNNIVASLYTVVSH